MKVAHDVYAETNPAFCAAALVKFTKAYSAVNPVGPETPVAYLALPLALSGELAVTFDGTNKITGLITWLERSPQVQVGLAERLNASLDTVTDAVRFGCFARVIAIGPGARLALGARALKPAAYGLPWKLPRSSGRHRNPNLTRSGDRLRDKFPHCHRVADQKLWNDLTPSLDPRTSDPSTRRLVEKCWSVAQAGRAAHQRWPPYR